jgi:hypothetical protein|tara:strand:+ start:1139 stop:1264 length:126 start_codon:yes stop_codon:yes gene_type:complete
MKPMGTVVIQGEAGFEEIQVLSFLLYARAMAIGGYSDLPWL